MDQQFVVSARKYRPQQFSAVVDQGNIVATLKNAILRQQLAHAYLFCGPRGVGKTTCARIFAKTINCLNPTPQMEACGECESCRSFAEGRSYCIHELDAASNNSVDDIRELIDKVRIPPQIGKYSVYIIDEVHMLSQAAFNAFLKTLEEPPAYALFILATTEKHKVLPTILSRCQSFDFNRISIKAMVQHLGQIAQTEGVTVTAEALQVIAQKADGALRDALTLLDQCIAVCGKDITYQQVITNLNVLDREYYFRLVQMALDGAFDQMLVVFDQILSKGFNALHFIGALSSHFRDLLVCKQPHSLPLLEYGEETAARFRDQAAACSLPFLFKALSICTQAEAGYKSSTNPRLLVELALVRLSQITAAPQPVAVGLAATPVPVTPPATAAPAAATPPAPQPAAIPDPQPDSADTAPKGLSIKSLLQDVTAPKKDEEDIAVQNPSEEAEITEESIAAALPGLMRLFEGKAALTALFDNNIPVLVDGHILQFSAANDLQAPWVAEKWGKVINRYLKQTLHNRRAEYTLVVKPKEANPDKPALYMPEEKAKFIMQQHPEVAALQNDLNLDIV